MSVIQCSQIFTNDLILKKVYREKKIKTKLKKEELKELPEICTKEMHFTTGWSMHGLVPKSSFSQRVHGPPRRNAGTTSTRRHAYLETLRG